MRTNIERFKVIAHPISDAPVVPCSRCSNLFCEVESLERIQVPESVAAQHFNKDWEPSWIEENFSCKEVCEKCQWFAWVTGRVEYRDISSPEEDSALWESYFEITHIHPYIILFEIPQATSHEFQETLLQSFEIIWLNPDAAANRIRVAVEVLLSDMKIPKKKLTRARKRVPISAHERIKLCYNKHPQAARYLEAAKWIGNDGSHETGLTKNDILDGLLLIREALRHIYPERTTGYADKLAKRINKSKTAKLKKPPF